MQIALRPARPDDFEFCKCLYFAEMAYIIEALHLNWQAQAGSFAHQWILDQVRVITLSTGKDETNDIGWLQTVRQERALFLSQLFIDGPLQRQGIGTELMRRLIVEATDLGQPLELDVVKINPALRLYQRLGFCIIGEEQHKFNMRRVPGIPLPIPDSDH